MLPQTGLTGQDLPARHEVLAAALSTAAVPTRSATIISTALEQVRHHADPDTARQMEHSLTRTALESDPDFVHRTAKRWVDALDQDGTEPGEEELRHRQGAFIRKPRHGLHHLEVFATAEQYETLATAMNTATNPASSTPPTPTQPTTARLTAARTPPWTAAPGPRNCSTGSPAPAQRP
ncbi:hypothetical protein AHiyo8_20290 [Arthrobacter sp. Hiyo8]|nr:hypothetical protein AHiyo8_20290 [Arthrobacter sp. Hiyo8]